MDYDIIEEFEEPTEFTHPIAVVIKPNIELSICLDSQNLNKIKNKLLTWVQKPLIVPSSMVLM